MAENTAIEWAHHTFNPWIGCTKVSPACDHCYAEAWSKRYGRAEWGNHPRQRTSAANWRQPLKWNREAAERGVRYRVFCASLADVFDNHSSITSGWHGDLWHLIDATPHLDWLLLTKRPQNIPKMLPESYGAPAWGDGWPNVWLGTTAENQTEADRRVPHLLAVPARIRFLSCEPLLGPVSLSRHPAASIGGTVDYVDFLRGNREPEYSCRAHLSEQTRGIDWVIAGGESGSDARPMHPNWLRSLRDQSTAAGAAFHFKQWGEWHPMGEKLADGATNYLSRGKDPRYFREMGDGEFAVRVGKARAGRMLDGVIHDGFPIAASPSGEGAER